MLTKHLRSLKRNVLNGFTKHEPVQSMKSLLQDGGKLSLQLELENEKESNFQKVGSFMRIMGQEVKTHPEWPLQDILNLRMNLIREEMKEWEESVHERDMENTAKELADILYVVYGAGHALGIDLDRVFEEVQHSNLSKLGDDGKPLYNDVGKVQKGPNYQPPDMSIIWD